MTAEHVVLLALASACTLALLLWVGRRRTSVLLEVMARTPWAPLLVVLAAAGPSLIVAMVSNVPRSEAQSTPENTVKVVVDNDDAEALAAVGARGASLVAKRDRYQVVALDADAAQKLEGMAGVAVRTDFDTIALRRQTIHTRQGAAPAPGVLSSASGSRRLKLVQFAAPPVDRDLEQLASTGARVVQYVPQNAYIVWTDADHVSQSLRALSTAASPLQYYGDYHPDYALSPQLDDLLGKAALVEVTVQLYNYGKAVSDDVAKVEALANTVTAAPREVLNGTFINLRVSVRGTNLDAIAQVDSVVNIEPYIEPQAFGERQGQILAGNLTANLQSPSGAGYLSWLAANGFPSTQADYPVVVVVDDGVDNGTTTPANSEFRELDIPANPSRLAFAVLPPGSSASGANGPDGHGNINASIIGGYNAGTGASVEDASGFNYGVGISPFGRLANVRIFHPGFDNGAGDTTMVSDYYARGARISSNSWGANVAGAYDSSAQEYDALTRDARPSVSGNQEILFVFAAGNAGPSAGSVGSPGTGKNLLTVGASENSDPASAGGDGCGETASDGNDARDMASFSSRGPCSDNRIKPEIVAPGTFIQGAASQPSFNGSSVCGAPSNDFAAPGTDALFPAGTAYTWSSGTSHSTPGIAGYTSLIHEFLARVYGITTPSPALVKAYVVHSGRHLTGAGANENLPGVNQGFGLADMGFGFDTTSVRFFHDQATVFGASGQSATFNGAVANPGEPIRVALVWTDAPGSTVGNAYVNDLDLVVTVGGNTYRGNNFTLGVSHTGGTADPRDNSEAVFLLPGSSGAMSITVNATTIAGNGVPGNADATDQDFALVAYNFTTVVSAGTITLSRGTYNCSDSVGITALDSDLTGTGTLNVGVVTTGGDSETVALTETPASSGTFVGSIATNSAGVVTNNGTLQVANGGTITATYNDADDGTSNPAVVQDTATVDCVPPVASNVMSINIGGTQATVTLDTNEAATVQVRYGTSCGSLTQTEAGPAAGTSHQIPLTGLSPLTQYFFVVDSTDAAGNLSTDNNGGSCYSFTTLAQPDYFTELFTSGDNDLDNQTFTFAPDGSGDYYAPCRAVATSFPTDPTGGTVLPAGDDTSTLVTLGGGMQVSLYGTSYSSFYVGSNGYITFTAPDTVFVPSLAIHFGLPRVAALFDDLNASAAGTVSWKQLADRVAVTFASVPEYATSNSNNFQIELFFDGTIRISYLAIAATGGLAGLSRGLGTPGDFLESNLSAYGPCSAGTLSLNQSVYSCAGSVGIAVTDGDLTNAGSLSIAVTTSGGDSETVALTETPAASSRFVGSIPTATGVVASGDATLEVANGQTITATYNDADHGNGMPATVQDTATVDCLPPVISNVATTNVGTTQATATFDTSDPSTVQVRYGTSCGALAQTQAGSVVGTTHQVALTGLVPLTQYFFAVDATDGAGNAASNDNGGACYSFTTSDRSDYFTELFSANDNDLSKHVLTFTPDGSGSFYSTCRAPALSYLTDPTGGTTLPMGDDSSVLVTLTGGAQVSLYGTSYSSFFVGSNGYITFTSSDTDLSETLANHFSQPRISGLFDDLDPSRGGKVSWKQLSDRVAVTFDDVPEYSTFDSNNFQIEMFFDGTIRITHLTLQAPDGLAGLSEGLGLPADFVESDLSTYGSCSAGTVSLNRTTYPCVDTVGVTVVDGDLPGTGTLAVALTTTGGDSEIANLTESPASSGIFVGSLPKTADAAVPANGILEAPNGDLITATYNDADHSGGVPATVQDTALVDCPCAPAPVVGCLQPSVTRKSFLMLKDNPDDTRDKLTWKWLKGDSPDVGDFGNPVSGSTAYTLCVYDQSAGGASTRIAMDATIPPGGTCGSSACWQAAGSDRLRYRDRNQAAAGVLRILLKAGAVNQGKIVLVGKGANLHMPLPASPTHLLSQDTKVIVQLTNSLGKCWGAEYLAPALKNDVDFFKDKNG